MKLFEMQQQLLNMEQRDTNQLDLLKAEKQKVDR
jgi:hypothetical protein